MEVDQTLNNWKTHQTAAFAESCDITRMTLGDQSFANQAAIKAKQAARMVTSLERSHPKERHC